MTCSPGGQFFYAVWNQRDFDQVGNEVGADAWFRRILFLDDYVPQLRIDRLTQNKAASNRMRPCYQSYGTIGASA